MIFHDQMRGHGDAISDEQLSDEQLSEEIEVESEIMIMRLERRITVRQELSSRIQNFPLKQELDGDAIAIYKSNGESLPKITLD